MIDSRKMIIGFGLCAFAAFPASLTVSVPTFAATAAVPFDTDKDGTLDLAEAKAAASATFDKLDKDSEGTVDAKEAKGHVSKSDFTAGDPDSDKTLTKDEYLGIVEKLFKAADPDSDGTLTAKELKSKAGKALVKLLK
ncbi:hypothetical protein [Methyloferula stellata]|jgi:hypothetical protein|uniref:hypothetical protein n=1 Tax=Methyloferula stellata TaxID=876270 RepID=UPI000369216E|nr:hypothetical protein [Methyloferula stellata]